MWIQNIYSFFNFIFEILTFRTKPECNTITNNNYDEYEFIMLNEL